MEKPTATLTDKAKDKEKSTATLTDKAKDKEKSTATLTDEAKDALAKIDGIEDEHILNATTAICHELAAIRESILEHADAVWATN